MTKSVFSYSFCAQSKTSLLHMKTHQVESTARRDGFKRVNYFILCTKLVNRCISAPLPNQAKDMVVVGISSPSFLHLLGKSGSQFVQMYFQPKPITCVLMP